jgi:acyl-CoA oxidase
VVAFGYGPEHVRAPIATGAEKARQDEARRYYVDQAASGDAPADEKVLIAAAKKAKKQAKVSTAV